MICRYELLPGDEHPRAFFFGFEKKRKREDEDDEPVNTDKKRVVDDVPVSTDKIRVVDDDEPVNTDKERVDVVDDQPVNTNEECVDAVNDQPVNTNEERVDIDDVESINKDEERVDDSEPINTNKERVNIDDEPINTDKKRTTSKPKKPSLRSRIKKRISSIKANKYYRLASDKPLRKKIIKWEKRLIACTIKMISFEYFRLHTRVGYGNPAALGKAYGYFIATREALALRSYSVDLEMEPVFTEECFDIDAKVAGGTTLSVILWYLLVIAATFPYLRVRKVIKNKNKK